LPTPGRGAGRDVLGGRGAQRVRGGGVPVDRDVGFQHLVHQVDIRHHRVGVIAAELEELDVRPAPQQLVDRARSGGWGEEVQQVHQIGSGAQHRAALLTGAEAAVPEQHLPVRHPGGVRALDLGGLSDRRRGDAVQLLLDGEEERGDSGVDRAGGAHRRQRLLRAAEGGTEGRGELLGEDPCDLLCAGQPGAEQGVRGRHVRGEPPDPLQPPQRLRDGRPIRFGHHGQRVRVGGQVVGGQGPAEFEVLVPQEGRDPGSDGVGGRGLRVGGQAGIGGQLGAQRGELGQRPLPVVHAGQVGGLRRIGARVVAVALLQDQAQQRCVEGGPARDVGGDRHARKCRPQRAVHRVGVGVELLGRIVPEQARGRHAVGRLPHQRRPAVTIHPGEVTQRTLPP
jgi:hypothetical protein